MSEFQKAYGMEDLERFAQEYGLRFGISWSEAERVYSGWVEEPFFEERGFKRFSDFGFLVNAMAEYAKSVGEPKKVTP